MEERLWAWVHAMGLWVGYPPFWFEAIVGAVVTFGATFYGVRLSLRADARRRAEEAASAVQLEQERERGEFKALLAALVFEAVTAREMLKDLARQVRPGHVPAWTLRTDVMGVLLGHTLLYRHGEYSFIHLLTGVRGALDTISNQLAVGRTAAEGFNPFGAFSLRDRAVTAVALLTMLIERADMAKTALGEVKVTDAPDGQHVIARAKLLLAEQDAKLAQLDRDFGGHGQLGEMLGSPTT